MIETEYSWCNLVFSIRTFFLRLVSMIKSLMMIKCDSCYTAIILSSININWNHIHSLAYICMFGNIHIYKQILIININRSDTFCHFNCNIQNLMMTGFVWYDFVHPCYVNKLSIKLIHFSHQLKANLLNYGYSQQKPLTISCSI